MPILTYGSISVEPIEFMSMDFDDNFDVRKIPKVSGESYIMSFGYDPRTISLKLRFNSFYTGVDTPDEKCEPWYIKGRNAEANELIVATVNYGHFIIEKLRTSKRNFIPIVNDLDITLTHVEV